MDRETLGGKLIYHIFYSILVLLFISCQSLDAGTQYHKAQFDSIYEPSGVVQLSNGDIVVIEDEPASPLWLMQIRDVQGRLVLIEKKKIVLQTVYDDLEGIAVGKNDDLFLITSHSTKKSGVRKRKREQLLRVFQSNNNMLEESTNQLLPPVLAKLSQQFGATKQFQNINIEGLSFDHNKERLFLGFRSPMTSGRALLLALDNPYATVSDTRPPAFGDKLIELDMHGGIRAICYDHIAKRYILTNEVEDAAGKKHVALWSWKEGGTKPTELKVPALDKLKNVEGVSIIIWQGNSYVLLVCDDGNKKKNKGAHYSIIDYADLQ